MTSILIGTSSASIIDSILILFPMLVKNIGSGNCNWPSALFYGWAFYNLKKKLVSMIATKVSRIQTGSIYSICSLESELYFDSICSIRILNIFKTISKMRFLFFFISKMRILTNIYSKYSAKNNVNRFLLRFFIYIHFLILKIGKISFF